MVALITSAILSPSVLLLDLHDFTPRLSSDAVSFLLGECARPVSWRVHTHISCLGIAGDRKGEQMGGY